MQGQYEANNGRTWKNVSCNLRSLRFLSPWLLWNAMKQEEFQPIRAARCCSDAFPCVSTIRVTRSLSVKALWHLVSLLFVFCVIHRIFVSEAKYIILRILFFRFDFVEDLQVAQAECADGSWRISPRGPRGPRHPLHRPTTHSSDKLSECVTADVGRKTGKKPETSWNIEAYWSVDCSRYKFQCQHNPTQALDQYNHVSLSLHTRTTSEIDRWYRCCRTQVKRNIQQLCTTTALTQNSAATRINGFRLAFERWSESSDSICNGVTGPEHRTNAATNV